MPLDQPAPMSIAPPVPSAPAAPSRPLAALTEMEWHLWEQRDLILMLVRRDIVIKYKQSIMGFFWAILMPILVIAGGILVRTVFATMAGESASSADLAAITVKAVPWAFVVAAIRFSTNSLVANAALVTKIYLPRQVFPIAAVLSQVVDLLIATGPVVLLLAWFQVGISSQLLWIPVLLLILLLNVLAAGIVLSAASLFFRDVKYLVEVGLTFAIFVTPVFYGVADIPRWSNILQLNPIAPILEAMVAVVVEHRAPDPVWLPYSAIVGLVGLALAAVFFRRVEPLFAERI